MAKHPVQQNINIATDAVIFTVREGELMALLIKMKKKPYENQWAVPGGLLGDNETTESAAKRILKEQTGVNDVYLEQLRTFDDEGRDKIGRVVSVAYFALIPSGKVSLKTTDKYADVKWVSVNKLPKLAYDHKRVLRTAVQRLQAKLEYSNIAYSLLPKAFPLSQLQDVYEIILGREIDKRNFRKKLMALDVIETTGKREEGAAHRPAELYRFKTRTLEYADIL